MRPPALCGPFVVPSVTDLPSVRVSIVIPTLDGRELLAHALRALDAQSFRDFEVIVVDNGSTDGTAEMLQQAWPTVRVIALERNVGFAAAANHGIRAARGSVVVLLNNDTEAHPEWLGRLVAPFVDDPRIASCASRVRDFVRRDRIDSAGDQLGLVASQIGHGERDGPRFAVAREVLSACAAAAAYRRDAVEEVGLFDESYGSYLEDVDLGVRLRLAGHRCWYVPEAIVYHHGSATARRLPRARFFLVMRNQLILFLRCMPWPRLAFGLPLMCVMPFVAAVRDGHSAVTAGRAVIAALREWRSIRRGRTWRRQATPAARADFDRLLASPWIFQRRGAS